MNTLKDFIIKRNEDFAITISLTDKTTKEAIPLTGLTGLDIQFAIKTKVEDADYINHKDLGPAAVATKSILTSNKQLNFLAKSNGPEGNDISINYVDPSAINQSLAVSVIETELVRDSALITNNNIIVSLATDGAGAITTVANDIKTLIDGDSVATTGVGVAPHKPSPAPSASCCICKNKSW